MFEQVIATLEDSVGGLCIPVDGVAITKTLELSDLLNAKITDAVGEFDRGEAWRDDGATSMTAWLKTHADRTNQQAASLSRTARRLGQLPVTAEAYRSGMLSTGQVQAVVVNLNDDTAPLFAEGEADLVPQLAVLPVREASSAMQTWADRAEDSLNDPTDPEPEPPERSLHLSRTLNGRRELHGSFDPETGALTETALRLAEADDAEGEPARTPAEKRADAFGDIMRHFLDHQNHTPGGRHRPHLNVFVDLDQLEDEVVTDNLAYDMTPPGSRGARPHPGPAGPAGGVSPDSGPGDNGPSPATRWPRGGWLTDGTILSSEVISRLACDAGLHRIVTVGRSSILDYGHTTRVIPTNLYNALVARDRECRFPGCDRPSQWCEGHHVIHWEHGGPTSLDNLVLVCSRHHHLLHGPGWQVKHKPDGTLDITRPDGQVLTSRPPGRPPDLFGSS